MELTTYISVQLPNEAGEVVVLEVPWQQHCPKDMRIPNYEAIVGGAPRHNSICGWVINHVVCLGEERRRAAIMEPIHWPRLAIGGDCR